MVFKATTQVGTNITVGGSGSPTMAYGTGVPSTTKVTGASTSATGTPIVGSLYIRTDGTAGARIYWYYGGVWLVEAGV